MKRPFRQQRTIAAPAVIDGVGYWTGHDVHVEFRPATPNTGITFVRSDLVPSRRIRALSTNRVETPRRTTLTENGGTVEMVEHIMAALSALRIDNCEVWVDALEMPAGDGSSQNVVEALSQVATVTQDAIRPVIRVEETVRVGNDDVWIEARPRVEPGLRIDYELDYGASTPIGRQTLDIEITPDTFRDELAAARTFVLEDDARRMRSRGLGARTTYQDVLVFGPAGPIENELRFPDECVRHKILDIVGDLALTGCDLNADIRAYRSGHLHNAQLLSAILAAHDVPGSRMRYTA